MSPGHHAERRTEDGTRPREHRAEPVASREPAILALTRAAGSRAVSSLLDGTGGKSLPQATRERMEAAFEASLDGVRIHYDERSAAFTEALGARAATRGEHVHFGLGEYRPDSAEGRVLLAHELAHVIQQRGGAEATGSRAAAEAEADAVAAGTTTPTPGTAPAGAVQLASHPRGRARYPELDWSDFSEAYAKLTPAQRRQLDIEEGTPLQAQAAEAEEAATPAPDEAGALAKVQSAVGTVQETAGEVASGVSGLTLINALRDLEPSKQGERLAQAVNDRSVTFRDVADAIDNADSPERVAYAFMRSPLMQSSLLLDKMSSTQDGRYLLARLFVRVTEGTTGPIEGFVRGLVPLPLADDSKKKLAQAARIMRARTEAVPLERWAKAKPRAMKVFPFQMQGLTTFSHTPMDVRVTPDGKLLVEEMNTGFAGSYPEEYKTLPPEIVTKGVEIDPDEIVAIRRYDKGGSMEYMPAIYLLQLAQEYATNTSGKIQTVAGLGAAVGGGLPSTLGKTGLASALARADQATLAVGAINLLVEENRSWLEEEGYGGFLDTLDLVNAAASIYGLGQLARSAPQMLRGLHESYANLRERQRIEALPPERSAVLQQIEGHLDALPKPPLQEVGKPQQTAAAIETSEALPTPERQQTVKPPERHAGPKPKVKSNQRKAAARERELRELERQELEYEEAAGMQERREREQRRDRENERQAARERPPTPEEVEADARAAADKMLERAQGGELSSIQFTRKQAVLKRFKRTLARTNLTPVEQNRTAGAFNEALTRSAAALETQPSYVAGAPVQKGMRVRPPAPKRPQSLAKVVRPDEIIRIKGPQGRKVKAVLERKADDIHDLSTSAARARAREYTNDAIKKAVNLPTGMPQAIRYTNLPASAEARAAMLEQHFRPDAPFLYEVHLGTEVVTRAAWEAERAAAQPKAQPTVDKPSAQEGLPGVVKPSGVDKPPVVEKLPESEKPPGGKQAPGSKTIAGSPQSKPSEEPWSLEAEVKRQRELVAKGLISVVGEAISETAEERDRLEQLQRLRRQAGRIRSGY